jgi:pimeloyl-ACP methyl ester carboxylesterase
VAEDPRSQSDTEDVPDALAAFRAERPAPRERDAIAVSRAAALLSLVRPRQTAPGDYRLATEESRELLRFEPVEPFDLGRGELATELANLGGSGARAAQRLRSERSLRPDARGIMGELRVQTEPERDALDAAQADAATELFSSDAAERGMSGRDAAARLIAASLLDDDPLVQVAAAGAALRVDRRNPVAEAILGEAAHGSGEIAELGRAILANDRRSDARVIEIEYSAGPPDSAADATLVHGTWARGGRWWRPDGSLFEYLQEEARLFPHLYRGPDPFKWSGYFSFRVWTKPKPAHDWNRQQAADSLAWWAHRRLTPNPDLIGHSYGGSLAMMTTQSEKRVRGMLLLSPAVHRTCLPDPANYEQILHVWTKLDLVLLGDISTRSLLRSLPNVTQRLVRRRGLTGHSATHDPAVWRQSGLADYVRDEWLGLLSPRA